MSRGESGEAKGSLKRALRQAHGFNFTPSALEALVVATGMGISSLDERLLELVASQPAATYGTRLRAIDMLEGATHWAPALSTEQVYEIVSSLGDRLEREESAASVDGPATATPD